MKTKNFLLCALLMGGLSLYGQVKIGDNPETINPASLLELESTDKALVVSRVSTAQMNAIMPNEGAIVFNTDVACLFYYDGLQWNNMCEELPIEFATEAIVNTAPTMVITQNGDVLNFEVGQISSENIVDFSIAGLDIQNNTITDEKLAANSVGTEELQDNTITDLEINYAEVTLSDFTNDADFITAADILSADAGNDLSFGLDGGAYFNAEPFEIAINQLEADLDLKEDVANKSTDVTLGNSDILYPTQNAVKTYVDNVVGGSAQTIVSGDPGNSITAGGDGGAFLNITPLQDQVGILQGDLSAHITADADLDEANELISDAQLTAGNILEITEAGVVWPVDLSGLAGGGGSTEVADQTTIEGLGTVADPFRVANNGIGTAQIANGAVSLPKIQPSGINGQVLTTTGGTVTWADPAGGGTQNLTDVLSLGNDAGGLQITNLLAPTLPDDAATKAYVDAIAGGGAVEVADQITIVGLGSTADPFRVNDGGITDQQLADGAVTSIKIQDGSVTTPDLADDSVTLNKILEGAEGQILTTVGGVPVWAAPSAAGAVLTDNATIIGDGTAGNELQVADGGIGTQQLDDNAVTTTKILDGEVQTADIADDSVTPEKIVQGAAGEVLTTDGAGDVVWAAPTAGTVATDGTTIEGDGTIGNELQVVDGGIGTPQLADNAVTSIKILDGEVQSDDIADNAVVTTKIADGAVTEAKINPGADGQVLTTVGGIPVWTAPAAGTVLTDASIDGNGTPGNELSLADDAVTTPKILDSNVTPEKIAAGADDQVLVSNGGLVTWTDLPNTSHTGTPNGIFFAEDPSGAPIDDADSFFWDPALRVNSGGLGIGLDGAPHADVSKVHIREQVFAPNIAYPLLLQNDVGVTGNTVGILMQVAGGGLPYIKGGLVFERTGGFGEGSFHFLQSTDGAFDTPNITDDATFTITSTGDVGIGTVAPQNKLHVTGQTRSEGYSSSEGNANEPAYSFHTGNDSNTGMFRAAPDELGLSTGGTEALRIDDGQQVGIGVAVPLALLHVAGTARFDGTVTLSDGSTIPDYVFQKYFTGSSSLNPDYEMLDLDEVSSFIAKYHHLPGVASSETVARQGGLNLNQSLLTQLEKIEELFLHTIEQQEQIEALKAENDALEESLNEMKARMSRLEELLLKKTEE